MVTTKTELATVEGAYESGASEYINKPIIAEELLAKVKSCLGQ